MKILKLISVVLLCSFAVQANAKNVVILATGGTISGAGESSTASKYSASQINIEQILKASPGIEKFCDIEAEQIMQTASQDMNSETWITIANKVNETLSQRSVDAVIVTHGTDTLEETAYFLNLVVKSKKPVILVGSMRPSTSLSADGAINLYNAVALAADDSAYNKGVLVLLNDEVYAARDVAKTHTTNVASFKAYNSGAIGDVHYGKVNLYYQPLRAHTSDSEFNIKKISALPKADIVYAYAGADATTIKHSVDEGAKAIILAGVGDGNIDRKSVEALIEAAKKGVLVVRSSHLGTGAVQPNVEINDDEYGFVTADNLSPQKARVLAMLALTKTNDVKKIREMFARY